MASKRLPRGQHSYGVEDGWVYTPGYNLHDREYVGGVKGAVGRDKKTRLYWASLWRRDAPTIQEGFPCKESAMGWCDLNWGSV